MNGLGRISRIGFVASLALLLGGSALIWVAMHRNIYGTGGQFLPWWEAAWRWISGSGSGFPVVGWAEGFLLRPGLTAYAAGYLGLLAVLRYSPIGRVVSLKTLLLAAAVVGLPILLMPYLMSSDVFDYGSYARLAVLYKSNPYMSSISEYPLDAFYDVTCWKSTPSVYGPVWTMLSILLIVVSQALGGSVGVYLLLLKSSMFAFQLVSGALIWKTLEQARVPDRAFRTAIFLFNPIVMMEFPGNGHNEAMMIALLLGGILLDQRGRWALATLCFTAAVQTKFYCLPAFCLYVAFRCWKADSVNHALRRFAALWLVFGAFSLVLYLPFGVTATTILAPFYGPSGDSMTKSLSDYLASGTSVRLDDLPVIGILFRGYTPQDLQRIALLATFAACAGGAFYARSLSRAVTAMGFYALVWCVIGATWFMPWYVTLVVAFIPLTRSAAVGWASATLSFTVFFIHLLEGGSFSPDANVHNFAVTHFPLFVFGPPILVLLALAAWAQWGARERSGTLPPEN